MSNPGTPPADDRQMIRRWLALLVFVVVLGTAFVLLGRWQLARLDQRRHSNAVVQAHENAAPLPFEEAFGGPVGDDDQWVRVEARGTYDAAHQYVLRYRSNDGKQGYEVVTPLDVAGRTVLVDRGFVRASPGEQPHADVPPTGTVHVVGYVRRSERGDADALTPVQGQMRLLNADAVAKDLGRPVVDGYLSLLTSEPGQDARLEPLQPPPLDEGPHLSYALQWFTFCGIALLGLVVFVRGDLRDRARRKAREGEARQTPPHQDVPRGGTDGDR